MSIWGKLIGGGTGFLFGGPLGAVLGLAVGHGVDSIRNADRKLVNQFQTTHSNQYQDSQRQSAFALGVIVLAAKLAKADGKVTEEEINTFKNIFDFNKEDQEAIGKIYNEAKKSSEGYEVYAKQLVEVFGNQQELYVELLNALYKIALSDGVLHDKEEQMIQNICSIFGMPESLVNSIKAQYIVDDINNLERDYKVLGIKSEVSDEDLKKSYHKLVKQYHPDHLVSKGLPEEFVKLANDKVSLINESYKKIVNQRKMSNK